MSEERTPAIERLVEHVAFARSMAHALLRGATLRGRVVLPPECSPGRVVVTADVLRGSASVDADAQGRWTLRGNPPGSWTVRAFAHRGERTFTAAAAPQPEEEMVLELR